jgi:putative peptide zinc metalloprotease protein
MTAFARSVLPIKAWKGRKLAPLKWWGKVVFALYTLITVPLLLLLVVLMVRSVPRVLATAWDSFGQQAQAFVGAQSHADILGVVVASAEGFLLLIPTVGLCYTLVALGRRLTVALWRWGKPSARRRAISGVGYVAAAGLLGFMWLPQVPLPGQPAAAAPVAAGVFSPVNWQPIAADERGTIQDVVADVVAVPPGSDATVQPTPAPSVAKEATPVAPQLVVPTSGGVVTAVPEAPVAQVTATAGSQTGAQLAPTAAARSGGQPTPAPAGTPTVIATGTAGVRVTPTPVR